VSRAATVVARLTQNFRDAARQLRHEPLYAAMMIGTLTIGIAAAGAIFSVVRGVVLRALPYRDADAVVTVQEYEPARHRDQTTVASANLSRLQSARSLSGISAFAYSEYVVNDDRDAERVLGAEVDGDLLSVLGLRPSLGRAITGADVGPNPAHVVILSDALWRRRLGADVDAVGHSMLIDGAPYTIIGVMAPGFEFPRNPSMSRDVSLWVPRRIAPAMMMRRGMRDLTVIARLQPGASIRDAEIELSTIAKRAAMDDAALNQGWQLRVIGLRDMMVGGVRPVLLMLALFVGVLLLIACANASAGALARITMRRQTLGVRLALGATHSRLIELLVCETLLLAAAAASLALPLSSGVRRMLVEFAPVAIPRQAGIAVDGWTIAFAGAIAVVVALFTSIGPTVWLRRIDLTTFLSDAGRGLTSSRARRRALATFVVAQLALATMLLAVTARLYSDYVRLNRIQPGFSTENITSATLAMGGIRYRDAHARSALTGQLLEKVRALPGVDHAAVTSLLPLSGGLMSSNYAIAGEAPDSSSSAALRAVSADFFGTVGISIKHGRPIEQTDDDGALAVAVVNEAFVRQSLDGGSALGQSIVVTPPGSASARTFQIVGIAGDAKERDLAGPSTPIIYFSDKQASFPHAVLVMRTSGPFPIAGVRTALRELDPSLALDDVGSLGARVRSSYALQIFLLTIVAAFGASGAVLIAVGVYGAVSFTASAEWRSIGVRLALGAAPWRVVALLIRRTGVLALAGCLLGVALTLAMPRLVGTDSTVGLGSAMLGAAVVLLIAMAATAVPALRASATDPLTVLRES
jgi:putative ABC transport system permease protein